MNVENVNQIGVVFKVKDLKILLKFECEKLLLFMENLACRADPDEVGTCFPKTMDASVALLLQHDKSLFTQ